jgi:Helix-turn-helix domain
MAAKIPVSDAEREQIRVLHARGNSAGAIAKQLGRSQSTITRQCKAMGLSFDRSATAEAVRAHQLDAKARRAVLAEKFLGDAERLREQLWVQCEYKSPVGGMEPTVLGWQQDEPTFADKEKIVRAAGLAADKHIKLAEFDAEGTSAAKNLLGSLSEALSTVAETLVAEQA